MHHRPHPPSGNAEAGRRFADIWAPGIVGRPRRRIVVGRRPPPLRTDFGPPSRAIAVLGAGGKNQDRQQPQHRPKTVPRRIPTLSILSRGPPNHREQALATSGSSGKFLCLGLTRTLRAPTETAAYDQASRIGLGLITCRCSTAASARSESTP